MTSRPRADAAIQYSISRPSGDANQSVGWISRRRLPNLRPRLIAARWRRGLSAGNHAEDGAEDEGGAQEFGESRFFSQDRYAAGDAD